MRNLVKYILCSLVSFCMLTAGTNKIFAQDKDYRAYTLFLYNFIKYVEWPTDNSPEFVIGVVGDSPIYKELVTLSETKKAKGKKIVIKVINTADESTGCSMIYFPSAKSALIKNFADKVKGKSVLLVAEQEGMARKGAAISFAIDDDDALKFDINKSVIDAQSLKIANVLIQLGMLVG